MFRRLWIPAMLSSFGWALSDMADSVVLGQKLGTIGLATIGLILPVYMVESMLAHGIGLGGCWCGIADDKSRAYFSEKFGLPGHILPAAMLAIGHPDERRSQPDRYVPEKVHYEKY